MLKSMNFLSGKSRGIFKTSPLEGEVGASLRVRGNTNTTKSTKSTPPAPVILGLVPRILFQQGTNLVNKLALLLHKCRLREDSWDKPKNDWCRERGVSAYSQSGRSMIEMLGVLAIIGVLSVGGIAGYSKAMMKYKINKMTEEYTMLMTGLMEYEESLFKNYADAEERNLAQFIIDAKLVPETWKLESQQYITDSLGNKINAYVDVAKTGVRFSSDILIVSGGENKNSEEAYQLCLALAHDIVYPLSASADFALLFINNAVMPNYGSYTVYSKSCRNSDFTEVKCMADMTLSEISAICKSCVQQNTCNVGVGWR